MCYGCKESFILIYTLMVYTLGRNNKRTKIMGNWKMKYGMCKKKRKLLGKRPRHVPTILLFYSLETTDPFKQLDFVLFFDRKDVLVLIILSLRSANQKS